MVLACLADVYARRGKARGTGDLTLTEVKDLFFKSEMFFFSNENLHPCTSAD